VYNPKNLILILDLIVSIRVRMAMFQSLMLVSVAAMVAISAGVAPGDEESICSNLRSRGSAPIPAYSANMRVLIDSWNYQDLLPPRTAAVWDQVDNDVNNSPAETTNVSFIVYKFSSIVCLYMQPYSGSSSPTLHANKLSKCVGSVLVHRTTG
jgi:hypothetical protein